MDSLSKKDLQVLAIYRQMMSGSALDPQTIKMMMYQTKNTQQFHKNYLIYLV